MGSVDADTDVLLDATTALIPPLLSAIEVLGYAGRHMHPTTLPDLLEQLAPYREPLKAGMTAFDQVAWPEHLQGFAAQAGKSASLAMQSFNDFLSAPNQSNATMAAYRAMGYNTKATEALYPLTQMLPPVSRFFLNPDARQNEELLAKLAAAEPNQENVGIMHASNASDERGGFSMYVPEYYDPEVPMPLVLALHGGSGHGRQFLWSWVVPARTAGAIVIAPTSKEGTWSLMGPDVDSENLDAMVAYACEHWNVDTSQLLLTGMSDGGTFTYVSGLREDAPFTHLAPSSASFHPMLVEMVAPERLQDLPIYLMHGALDWMFPVSVAREAQQSLARAGASVTYREIDNLSHTYPVEENPRILEWMSA